MKRVCAWCGKVMAPGTDPEPVVISHGICPDCAVVWMAEAETCVAKEQGRKSCPTI